MSSIARRAYSHLLNIRSRSAIPTALASMVQLFSRVFAGSQLEMRRGNGMTELLTGALAEGLPRGYVVGIYNEQAGSATNRIGHRFIRSDADQFDIYRNVDQFISTAVVGAGGLDQGVVAPDTWYALWAIGDSTRVLNGQGLWSLSFTAPVMPAGYDQKRRIGIGRTNATSNLNTLLFEEFHGGIRSALAPAGQRTRRYFLNLNVPLLLTNGQATVFTAVSLASQVPPSAKQVFLRVSFAPGTLGAIGDEVQLRPGGATAADGPVSIRRGLALTATQMLTTIVTMPVSPTQTVEYKVSKGGVNQNITSIQVFGFDDEI